MFPFNAYVKTSFWACVLWWTGVFRLSGLRHWIQHWESQGGQVPEGPVKDLNEEGWERQAPPPTAPVLQVVGESVRCPQKAAVGTDGIELSNGLREVGYDGSPGVSGWKKDWLQVLQFLSNRWATFARPAALHLSKCEWWWFNDF